MGWPTMAIEWLEVQPEGKKRMAVRDFVQGYKPEDGDRMGSYQLSSGAILWTPRTRANTLALLTSNLAACVPFEIFSAGYSLSHRSYVCE